MRVEKYTSSASLTWDSLQKAYTRLLNPPPIDYTLIISPKLEELIKLDMEWRKLDEVLYKQRWLKYDLNRKKSSRKRLPLPN